MAEAIQPIEPKVALQLVEVSELQEARDPVIEAADQLVVSDQPSLNLAGMLLTDRIKPTLKQIDASCGPVVAAANAAHKAATKQRNELKAPLLEAERLLKGKIAGYLDEQERLQRAEQARIDAEQRELREAAEKKAREEAEAEALAIAERLEAEGDSAAADAVLDAPIVVDVPEELPPPAIAAPMPAKVQGISTRKEWVAEVTDFIRLVAAVANGAAPLSLLKVDQTKLNQQVRALDGQVQYPGVQITERRVTSARAAS